MILNIAGSELLIYVFKKINFEYIINSHGSKIKCERLYSKKCPVYVLQLLIGDMFVSFKIL